MKFPLPWYRWSISMHSKYFKRYNFYVYFLTHSPDSKIFCRKSDREHNFLAWIPVHVICTFPWQHTYQEISSIQNAHVHNTFLYWNLLPGEVDIIENFRLVALLLINGCFYCDSKKIDKIPYAIICTENTKSYFLRKGSIIFHINYIQHQRGWLWLQVFTHHLYWSKGSIKQIVSNNPLEGRKLPPLWTNTPLKKITVFLYHGERGQERTGFAKLF